MAPFLLLMFYAHGAWAQVCSGWSFATDTITISGTSVEVILNPAADGKIIHMTDSAVNALPGVSVYLDDYISSMDGVTLPANMSVNTIVATIAEDDPSLFMKEICGSSPRSQI